MTASYKAVPVSSRASSIRTAILQWMLLGALLVPLVSCGLHAPLQVGDLRDKMFDAYGGRERLSQIHSIAAEGKITALMKGDHGVYRRALRMDGKLFVDIQYPGSRETRILNGTGALRGIDGKMEEVNGPGYLAMVYQYNELSMPFALLDGSFEVKDAGRESRSSGYARILRCTDRAGNSIDVFVDEKTYRIVRTLGSFSMGDTSTTLGAVFSDYSFVDGVLMPFKIVNYAGDTRVSETTIDDYLFNANLSDALFDPHARTRDHSKE